MYILTDLMLQLTRGAEDEVRGERETVRYAPGPPIGNSAVRARKEQRSTSRDGVRVALFPRARIN